MRRPLVRSIRSGDRLTGERKVRFHDRARSGGAGTDVLATLLKPVQ